MKAYSEDLRSRVIEAYRNGEGTQKELARRFCVSRSSVQHWVRLYNETGSLEPSKAARGPAAKLDGSALQALFDLVRQKPDATLNEYATQLERTLGLPVSSTNVCRALKKAGVSRKKNVVSYRKTHLIRTYFAL